MTATDAQKYTFLDTSIATPELTLKAGNVFDYTGATTGTNTHVSALLYKGSDNAYAQLADAGTLSATGINSSADGTGMASGMLGVSLPYTFDLADCGGGQLLASVTSVGNPSPRAKALVEGFIAGTAFLNQGADFLAGKGVASAVRAHTETAHVDLYGFAALGGGSLRHETGSHVDVDGYILIAGLAAARSTNAGDLTLGAFLEHGEGDHDTSNSFANSASVHGKDDADYTGRGRGFDRSHSRGGRNPFPMEFDRQP
ncbi:MAG: hypothetical protein LBF51_09575 [Zoogloeaceae bacterium]|nr:hypothetical protein [Zoogloeaceae bacterium]